MTFRVFYLCLCLLALWPRAALALKISPFKAALSAGDAQATQVFRVENNSAESAAVQVSVLTWDIAEDGTEHNADAESLFTVFPAQIVLKPHESRAVRVQYTGAAPDKAEIPFRLVAEQLPVRLADTMGTGSAVRFLLRFKAALYVTPAAARSDVKVRGAEGRGDRLWLTLANEGGAHALVRAPVVTLRLAGGKTARLSGAALKVLDGENIHPGRTRRFEIPLPPDVSAPVAGADLAFEPAF